MSRIDLSPLENSVARLAAGLDQFRAEPTDSHIRDGLIQQFEFTFDLAPKMLRRFLEHRVDSAPLVDEMGFSELLRTGFELGLLDEDWTRWRDFRDMRNITSHSYDQAKAIKVADVVPEFLAQVQRLTRRMLQASVE